MKQLRRSEAREAAFIAVFEYSFGQNSMDEIFENAKLCRNFQWNEYTRELAEGTADYILQIDDKIKSCLRNWTIERISKPALAILRCAVWELYYGGIEPEIAINEAVELAKKYAPDPDAAFINGVLGRMVRGDASQPYREEGSEENPVEPDQAIETDVQG